MISLDCVSYVTHNIEVQKLNFHLPEGSLAIVLGSRVSGKSDFLRVCMGKHPILAGEVFIEGENVKELIKKGHSRTLRHLGYVMQADTLLDNLTIAGNVGLPLSYHKGLAGDEMLETIKPLLLELNLWDKADKFPHEVSNDEIKSAQMARALVQKPKILLLDEPTSGNLDIEGFTRIMDCIRECMDEEITILMTTCYPSLLNRENVNKYICVNGMVTRWREALHSASVEVQNYVEKVKPYID